MLLPFIHVFPGNAHAYHLPSPLGYHNDSTRRQEAQALLSDTLFANCQVTLVSENNRDKTL